MPGAVFFGAPTKQIMKAGNSREDDLLMSSSMIVAVTVDKIYLLDWKGNDHKGTGPTKILFEFNRSRVEIKHNTSKNIGKPTHHIISLKEDGANSTPTIGAAIGTATQVTIECKLGIWAAASSVWCVYYIRHMMRHN